MRAWARPCTALAAAIVLSAANGSSADGPAAAQGATVQLDRNDGEGRLRILVDGKEAFIYRYGPNVEVPYYFPVRSPSGKSMTVEHPQKYPHHRSVWFADQVRLAGQRKVSFYNAFYTRIDKDDPQSPFRDHVRHVEFLKEEAAGSHATIMARLVWEMDETVPVLDEVRQMRVVALGDGQYLADLTFTVSAKYGDVEFVSDRVHYAWPYVRMDPTFAVEPGGGTITNSEGQVNQQQTCDQPARWVDYSNTIDGVTEGLAMFSHPENEYPHLWLTRDYGTFGPRREEARSGKPFTLKRGDSLRRRVAILVHRGDVKGGEVAARYAAYAQGEL